MPRRISFAKVVAIVGFLVLLSTTYELRSELLTLNRIHFSADNVRADYELKRLKETYPERVEAHQVALKNYEVDQKHYQEMMHLYQTDYDTYVQRIKDRYQPPQLPTRPQPPDPPEIQEALAKINAQFRTQKYHYFQVSGILNGIAWAAAVSLVGALLFLLMFDVDGQRWFYVIILGLCFVFLIGPAFHSILSAIAGFLHPPSVGTPGG